MPAVRFFAKHRLLLLGGLGALCTLAFAPFGWVPVAFASLPVLYHFVESEKTDLAVFKDAWFWGFGFFASGVYWFANIFAMHGGANNLFTPLAVLIVGAFFAALVALVLVFYRRLPIADYRLKIFAFALAYACAEWLSGNFAGRFPWFCIGYIWFHFLPMLQVASIVGIYGLSFVTLVVCIMPVISLLRRDFKSFIVFTLAFLSVIGWGYYRLAQSDDLGAIKDVTLRLVQPSIEQQNKWSQEMAASIVLRTMELSLSKGIENVTHVLWPETAIPFIVYDDSLALLHALLPAAHNYLIAGAIRPAGSGDLFNSMFVIDSSAKVVAHYDKLHLVPFGEYVPFEKILRIQKVVPIKSDFLSGGSVRHLISLPNTPPFVPLICYEVIFSGAVMDEERQAGWILNITNDGWLGDSTAPYQHLNISRVRAVEEGRPLVRVANSGISAVFDSYGRMVASLGLNKKGVLDVQLPLHIEGGTVFARISFYLNAFFAIALLLIIIGAFATRVLIDEDGQSRDLG